MNTYRTRNGRYSSRDAHIKREARRVKLYLALLVAAGVLMVAAETRTVEVAHVEASTTEEVIDDTGLCDLVAVICESEYDVEAAIAKIPHKSPTTASRIRTVYKRAQEEGVSADTLMHVAWCESMLWNTQSNLKYTFSDPKRGIVKGEQERSYGWYMIHQPDHHITSEQALDVAFSVDWAIEQIKQDSYPWYGYNPKTDTCRNDVPEYWL